MLDEFEVGDDVLMQAETDLKQRATDLKSRGLKPELREDIILTKQVKGNLLDTNISQQREYTGSTVPGMLSELNQVVRATENKLYLR